MLIARNPLNGEIIAEYPALTPTQMHERIGDADRAFDSWQSSTFEDRAKVLKAVAGELRADIHWRKELRERWPSVAAAVAAVAALLYYRWRGRRREKELKTD